MPTPIPYTVAPEQADALAPLLRATRQLRDLFPLREPIPMAALVTRTPDVIPMPTPDESDPFAERSAAA